MRLATSNIAEPPRSKSYICAAIVACNHQNQRMLQLQDLSAPLDDKSCERSNLCMCSIPSNRPHPTNPIFHVAAAEMPGLTSVLKMRLGSAARVGFLMQSQQPIDALTVGQVYAAAGSIY